MKAITFKSDSENKIDLLIKIAKEMGIETYSLRELTDEEMALPGIKPSEEQLEEWIAKENGPGYGIDKAFETVKKELAKSRKKKK
jgi:cytosine/adenosine deaminase-related metal-dependent hydrolase